MLANGSLVQPNDIIEIAPGDPLILQFETTDANASDSVSVVMQDPANPYMPWSIFYTSNNAAKPTGTFTWLTNNATPGDFFYFPITVQDNHCPIRGKTTRMFGVRVVSRATGIKEASSVGTTFIAYPNPFSEEVTFNVSGNAKAQSIVIYNLLGQQVDELKIDRTPGHEQKVTWKNAAKHASGTYIARLIANGKTQETIKFTRLP